MGLVSLLAVEDARERLFAVRGYLYQLVGRGVDAPPRDEHVVLVGLGHRRRYEPPAPRVVLWCRDHNYCTHYTARPDPTVGRVRGRGLGGEHPSSSNALSTLK